MCWRAAMNVSSRPTRLAKLSVLSKVFPPPVPTVAPRPDPIVARVHGGNFRLKTLAQTTCIFERGNRAVRHVSKVPTTGLMHWNKSVSIRSPRRRARAGRRHGEAEGSRGLEDDYHPIRERRASGNGGGDFSSDEFGHLQKSLNLPGDNSVYRTVCWMLRWPR